MEPTDDRRSNGNCQIGKRKEARFGVSRRSVYEGFAGSLCSKMRRLFATGFVNRNLSLTYPLHASIFDRTSRQEPWWWNANGGEPHPKPARQFRTPAEWRDLSDTLHVHYFHLGLMALGPVHYFSLRLGSSVETQASSALDALGWLTPRITRRLQQHLGRSVECYCVLEEDDRRRLHVHGEFNIVSPNCVSIDRERVKARKALRLAGGEWPKNKSRQFQAQVKARAPDAGWAGYLAKDFAFHGRILRPWLTALGSNYASAFRGNQVSRTKQLGDVAAQIYTEHRELVMQHGDS